MEEKYIPVDAAVRVVRYADGVPVAVQEMAAMGYKMNAGYFAEGTGHFLFFTREMLPPNKISDSDDYNLHSQVANTPDTVRDPSRFSH